MNEDEKPRGITTFRTILCVTESEARSLAAKHEGTVHELKRLFDGPSDWAVMVKL